jgi:hypothetical protein
MKTCRGMEVWLHVFLTSALDGGEWSVSRPCRFTPRETGPRYPLDRKQDGPQSRSGRSGACKILAPAGNRTPGRPNHSPSQYRLSYPDCTSSRPALGPTQPRIQWASGTLSPEVKRPGREADHSPPTNAEVKKMWIYTSTRPYAFMA